MRALLPLALLSFGCVDSVQAPFSARIDVPDDIEVGWGSGVNDLGDGLGAVFMARFLVFDTDSNTGDTFPLEKIEVEVTSGWGGLYILPTEALRLVDPPELPPDVSTPADIASYCEDEDGAFDNTEEWCSWYYNTVDGQFYEIGADYADAGGYAPNYAVLTTDKHGLATAYLYLDGLPEAESAEDGQVTYGEAAIQASIGHHTDQMVIRSAQ